MGLGEFEIIELFSSAGARRDDVVTGIGDDAAVVTMPAGQELALCTDTIIEGVHFPADTTPHDVGWRALAVNLSDIAAMGAEPRWATVSIALPHGDRGWITSFAEGFTRLARRYEVALVGGDTVCGTLAVTVQLAGIVPPGTALLRSGARVGDAVWVTGHPGDAAAGLALIRAGHLASDEGRNVLCRKFLRPEPRVEFGARLRGLASAAIDVSDGLVADAGHIAEQSGVGMEIDVARLPLSVEIRAVFDPDKARRLALAGGDDYELLFTVPAGADERLRELASRLDLCCTRVGRVVEGETVTCVLAGKRWMLSDTGFDHFASREDP